MEDYIYIDQTGVHAATFDEILKKEKEIFREIYGEDVYLDNDSYDGQWVTINAYAKYQTINAIINAYSQFSPSTATGERLSNLVKINGIKRHQTSSSTVDIVISGTAGTIINNGIVSDGVYQWLLPETLVVPFSGVMVVVAKCTEQGAIYALPNTVNQIITPTRGWQTANNLYAATVGAPVETDAKLRLRQTNATANPSRSIVKGILGSIQELGNVYRAKIYENDTNITDKNGLPPHSISVIVEGGDPKKIAETISLKKGPGCFTHGDILISVDKVYGVPMGIRFFRPEQHKIKYQLTLKPLSGFSEEIKNKIVDELVSYTNNLNIGESIVYTKLFVPANLNNSPDSRTFEISEFLMAQNNENFSRNDIVLPIIGSAICSSEDVEVIIL